ncbi:hypothetical protein BDR06DRAFT_980550 [Suillus hirtellus]|nr:hypothetical protein BDR06DRAFT_980550 [Suillus hirtellus]
MEFILVLQSAPLDDHVAKLDEEARSNLQNPPHEPPDIIYPTIHHSISTYYALKHSSQTAYERIHASTACTYPDANEMPSFYQIERMIVEYTGVDSITHDMCPDTCIAFTGPFADLNHCPVCNKPRYNQIKLQASRGRNKVARQFHTIPIGPQLQALYRDCEKKLFDELCESGGLIDTYDDFIMGSDYLNAILEGKITKNDIILMILMDGAQLYQMKVSDCWLYIWVVMDHAPDNEGLSVYDAWHDIVFLSHPYLFLTTTDGPGLIYFDGMVGHCSKNGCHLYCGVIRHQKERGTHYYPVLLRPNNFHVVGCNHPDVNVFNLPLAGLQDYTANLFHLTETGITKPSILLGLNPSHMLQVPVCFLTDIMHLAGLLSDLLLSLWCGTMDCAASDNVDSWKWRVMHGDVWEAHGAATWKFQLYLFGLAPALTYGLLPEPYWLNYCRLIAGFRIICQHSQIILGQWELEFKELYYQCHQDRIHFICPCAHQVNHLITEAIQKGPPEIRQPSEPYANLSREGVHRSQVNALKAMLPELDKPPENCWLAYPQGAEKHAITLFLNEPAPKIFKWAHLKLPNGQIACSHWQESLKSMHATKPLRVSCNVKFSLDSVIQFGEVHYFTQLAMETVGNDIGEMEWSFINVAVISLFSCPDNELLKLLSHVVASCAYYGDDDIRVIDIKSITDLVTMVPHHPRLPSRAVEDCFFMVEKPSLDVASFGILPVDDAVEGEDSDNDLDC